MMTKRNQKKACVDACQVMGDVSTVRTAANMRMFGVTIEIIRPAYVTGV